MLEKGGIHYNSTGVSCDYDTVVDGSDSTIMLNTVELSPFLSHSWESDSYFEKINSSQVYRSQPTSTSCCCFFLSKYFTFLCLQQSFYWKQWKSFIRIMVLFMMLNQSNFQASSKFAKLYSLKIHTSASRSKCERLPKFLGSWSICCPQATSICPLPQWAQNALRGLIQFQGQIIRFRHNWENIGGNFESSSSTYRLSSPQNSLALVLQVSQ